MKMTDSKVPRVTSLFILILLIKTFRALSHIVTRSPHIQNIPGGKSIFWEVTVSVIVSIKVCMYMCPIPNGFRDRAISL
jgi:hypothetical protein